MARYKMPSPNINLSALEPLYLPHEMPFHYRIRAVFVGIERAVREMKGCVDNSKTQYHL